MDIKDLEIKTAYDSSTDDILNDFYIPLLNNSIEYQRFVVFFHLEFYPLQLKDFQNLLITAGVWN